MEELVMHLGVDPSAIGSIMSYLRQLITDNIPIIIDGPNFINRLLNRQIEKEIISKRLSLSRFKGLINRRLSRYSKLAFQADIIEFVCSKKLFGSKEKKFTNDERDFMIGRFMREPGVHVEEVDIPGSSEKGVDNKISSKIETFSNNNFRAMILVSADRDFIPVLQKMRECGIRMFAVALEESFPIELVNESYATIDLADAKWIRGLFDPPLNNDEIFYEIKREEEKTC